jgi:hypothetical protein
MVTRLGQDFVFSFLLFLVELLFLLDLYHGLVCFRRLGLTSLPLFFVAGNCTLFLRA